MNWERINQPLILPLRLSQKIAESVFFFSLCPFCVFVRIQREKVRSFCQQTSLTNSLQVVRLGKEQKQDKQDLSVAVLGDSRVEIVQFFFANHQRNKIDKTTNHKKNALFSFFFGHWMIFEFLLVLFCWVKIFLGAEISSHIFSFRGRKNEKWLLMKKRTGKTKQRKTREEVASRHEHNAAPYFVK